MTSLAVSAVPAPRQALLELPFWLTLLACALIPGSVAPWIEWNGLPARLTEVSIAATAILYLALCAPRRLSGAPGYAWKVAAPFLLAAFWATVLLLRSDLDEANASAMAATLVFALAAPLLAASLIDSLTSAAVEGFLWRFTIFLAALSALYTAESILSLGLRSEASRALLSDFGMDRVRGPLYGSATGYVALLPALGFAIQRSFEPRAFAARLATVSLVTAILGMGSRAGVILTGIYLVALVTTRRRLHRKAATFAAVAVLGTIAAAAVFSRANPERLRSLGDSGRELTHRMVWTYARSEPLAQLAAGAGYGAIWPWYLRDAQAGERVAAGDNLTWTPFGASLYHSHSTALTMAVELGFVGLLAFAWQLAVVGGLVGQSRRSGRWQAFAFAAAVASLGFFFDLFLFKNTTVNLIWWIYVAALARLLGEGR